MEAEDKIIDLKHESESGEGMIAKAFRLSICLFTKSFSFYELCQDEIDHLNCVEFGEDDRNGVGGPVETGEERLTEIVAFLMADGFDQKKNREQLVEGAKDAYRKKGLLLSVKQIYSLACSKDELPTDFITERCVDVDILMIKKCLTARGAERMKKIAFFLSRAIESRVNNSNMRRTIVSVLQDMASKKKIDEPYYFGLFDGTKLMDIKSFYDEECD